MARSLLPAAAIQGTCALLVHGVVVYLVFRNQGDSAFRAGLASLFISLALLANQYTYAILQGLQHFRALSLYRLLPVLLYGAAMLVLFITDIGTLLVVTVVWAGTVLVSSMIGLGVTP